jgi:hypothetical protein
MLEKDNHNKYMTTSEDEFKMIQKIIELPDQNIGEIPTYEFNFTRMVP